MAAQLAPLLGKAPGSVPAGVVAKAHRPSTVTGRWNTTRPTSPAHTAHQRPWVPRRLEPCPAEHDVTGEERPPENGDAGEARLVESGDVGGAAALNSAVAVETV